MINTDIRMMSSIELCWRNFITASLKTKSSERRPLGDTQQVGAGHTDQPCKMGHISNVKLTCVATRQEYFYRRNNMEKHEKGIYSNSSILTITASGKTSRVTEQEAG